MTRRQQLALALVSPLTLVLVVILALSNLQTVAPSPALATTPIEFDAARAQTLAAELETLAPQRVVGSPEASTARQWVIGQLTTLGLETQTFPFEVNVNSQTLIGVQVSAVLAGASDEVVLMTAHVDTPRAGGRSNALGTAAVLELARVLSAGPQPARTFIFLFSDSREYGRSWGMQKYLEDLGLRPKIVAALNVDASQGNEDFRIEGAGFYGSYAPLWLRQLSLRTAQNFQPSEILGAEEFVARALPFDMTEHGQLLRANVPAVSFASTNLSALGPAAEVWARTVAALQPLPAGFALDWRVTETQSLPAAWVLALSLLLFLPLFLATILEFWEQRPHPQALWPEALGLIAAALPWLNGYAVLFILLQAGLLPFYESFPATLDDAFLKQPADWAWALVMGVMGLSFFDVLARPRGWARLADRLNMPTRRATLLLVLSVVVLAVWLLNPFAAMLLLAAAAFQWIWIVPRPLPAGRMLNTLLAVGGLLPFFGLCIGLSLMPQLGVWSWFLFTGAMYGLFPFPVILLFALSLALALRFTWLGLR